MSQREARLGALLAAVCDYLEALAGGVDGEPAESLRFAAGIGREQTARGAGSASLPDFVATALPDLLAGAWPTGARADVLDALTRAFADLNWSVPMGYGDGDPRLAGFLRGFASAPLIGRTFNDVAGPWPDTRIRLGFTLQGPDVFYPPHAHRAEETYVVLAGDGLWRQGESSWRRHSPGTVVFHGAYETHAMWTREQPLLALFCWVKDLHEVPFLTDDRWHDDR